MHSSQPNGMFVRSSNSPVGSREQPRGQSDYSAWKDRLRQQQEYEAAYGASAMDVDYSQAPGAAGNPGYGAPYQGAPPASYPQAGYAPQAHAPPAQYQGQPGYGYTPTPVPAQYSPPPQAGDRYTAMAPPPMPASYGQDGYVHGSNFQAQAPSGGYASAGPARIPPTMPLTSGAQSRTYNAPVAGTPVYGTETDQYPYPPPAGNPPTQAFPADTLYGRGAYTTAAATLAEASSDDLGSPAGATQRQGYPGPSDPQYDDIQNPALQSATTPTTTAPGQIPSSAAPAPRRERDRDSEPRERERERDRERDRHDHRSRQERDERRHRHR